MNLHVGHVHSWREKVVSGTAVQVYIMYIYQVSQPTNIIFPSREDMLCFVVLWIIFVGLERGVAQVFVIKQVEMCTLFETLDVIIFPTLSFWFATKEQLLKTLSNSSPTLDRH
jgi:hypothetical protein